MLHRLLIVFLFLFNTLAQAETISAVTTGMEKQQGLLDYYWDEQNGRLLLELDTFDRDLLLLTGLAQGLGSNPVGLDRNQVGDSRVVRFERVGNKVLLHQVNLKFRAQSENPDERRAVTEAFATSVIWGFEVIAEEGESVLLDFTPFILSDQHGIAARLKQTGQGNYSLDQSRSAIYLARTKSFPKNSEFEAQLTFKGSDPGKYLQEVVPTPELVTLRQHLSLVALPEEGYKPRRFHANSGYFPLIYRDYATAIDQPMDQRLIFRHRLEKRPGSDTPVQPIVYYIDPGVPEPIRGALMEGASWWNEAFEAAGFENAFQVKLLPEGADPLDVRYNVINWVHRSTRGWSYGYSIYDPRTGEILKGNVTLGSLRVRQDFLIAQGLLQPYGADGADTAKLKEMALARIRQLSAHEVGHTIGLAHNFIASAQDRASVMDYPAPLVTLNGKHLNMAQAYDRGIGAWDKLAIRYGYGIAEGDESEYLESVLGEAKKQKLRFITDRDSRSINDAHGGSHLWDNGEEPLKEFARMTRLRQHALENFGPAANAPSAARSSLDETLVPVYYGHRYQAEAVGKLIGGLDYDYLYNDAGAESYRMVDADRQQQAIDALVETLQPEFLTLPEKVLKLLPPKAFGYSRSNESFPAYTGIAFDAIAMAEAAAGHTYAILLHPERAARLQQQRARRGAGPGLDSLLAQLTEQSLANERFEGLQAAIHQRVNHVYIQHLMLLAGDTSAPESARARASFELAKFQHAIGEMKLFGDAPHGYNAHYFYEANRIDAFMRGDLKVDKGDLKPMPPGSPI
ncbi:zinc-dependent metalloprotease [Microbulbifer elongatus]|uniref:Zinc-dependent metalloprotease n=1 Tax=Microbulbifer elongatus TaxID=86173 RepID=A0ABT1P679_9GAMM|nr:zinc-dependent metalloprotease [Microbulbifer elongatus]MCQ3830987.1 zinc-dependent metalloprotease [Microbulbifer elongatus]